MFVLNAKKDLSDAAKDARKNPPVLITILLTFIIYLIFALCMNKLIGVFFKGLSAFITHLGEAGKISTTQFEFYKEMNTFAYTLVFIVLVPLAFLYAKFVEGRRQIRNSFMMGNKAERFPHLLIGFIIGTAFILLTIGVVKFSGFFSVKLNENVNWICRLLGLIFCAAMVYGQEYFFRGFLLTSIHASTGKLFAAVIVSSLLYSLAMHFFFFSAYTFSIWYIMGNFFLAVFLSMLMIRFKSLYVSMGAHFAITFITQMVFGLPLGRYAYYFSFLSTGHANSNWFNNSMSFDISSRLVKTVSDSEIVCMDSGLAFILVGIIAVLVLFLLPAKDPNAVSDDEPVMAFKHVTENSSAQVAEKKTDDEAFTEEATAEASDVLKERLSKNEIVDEKPAPAAKPADKPVEAVKKEPVFAEPVKTEPETKPEPAAKPEPQPDEDIPEIKPGVTVSAKKSNPFMSAAKTVKRQEYTPKAKAPVKTVTQTAAKPVDDEDWGDEEKREHVDATYLPIDQYLKDKNAK